MSATRKLTNCICLLCNARDTSTINIFGDASTELRGKIQDLFEVEIKRTDESTEICANCLSYIQECEVLRAHYDTTNGKTEKSLPNVIDTNNQSNTVTVLADGTDIAFNGNSTVVSNWHSDLNHTNTSMEHAAMFDVHSYSIYPPDYLIQDMLPTPTETSDCFVVGSASTYPVENFGLLPFNASQYRDSSRSRIFTSQNPTATHNMQSASSVEVITLEDSEIEEEIEQTFHGQPQDKHLSTSRSFDHTSPFGRDTESGIETTDNVANGELNAHQGNGTSFSTTLKTSSSLGPSRRQYVCELSPTDYCKLKLKVKSAARKPKRQQKENIGIPMTVQRIPSKVLFESDANEPLVSQIEPVATEHSKEAIADDKGGQRLDKYQIYEWRETHDPVAVLAGFHHSQSTGNFCCHLCKSMFDTKEGLESHKQLKHVARKRFHCTLCSKSFTQKPSLNRHVNEQHTKRKKYECKNCGETFYNRQVLSYHMASKHGEGTTYCCPICKRIFVAKQALQMHMDSKFHSTQKRFQCPIQSCLVKFRHKDALTRHIKAYHA